MSKYAESSLTTFMKQTQGNQKGNSVFTKSGGSVYFTWQLGTLLQDKGGFLSLVFTTLLFQLIILYAVIQLAPTTEDIMLKLKSLFWVLAALNVVIIAVLAWIPMHPAVKFMLFTAFSVVTGLLMKLALHRVPPNIIKTSLIGTIAVFVTFFIIGLVLAGLGIDLGPLGIVLLVMLMGLIIANVVYMFMKQTALHTKALATISLLLFSIYIAFDTNIILQREYHGDFVTASLDYYLDIINLFLNFVTVSN